MSRLSVAHLRKALERRLESEGSRLGRLADQADALTRPRCSVQAVAAERHPGNPILTPASDPSLGDNLNGPSVIRMPDWAAGRLGRYHLYFAHHAGDHIRLAYADRLEGPWRVHPGGVLHLSQAPGFEGHIASPDVHVLEDERLIRMYFHGPHPGAGRQATGVAHSQDGLAFRAEPEALGRFYFRVWRHGGAFHALAKSDNSGWNDLHRSESGVGGFVRRPKFLRRARHTAVLVDGDRLLVLYTRVGDRPERILLSTVDMRGPWTSWRPSRPIEVLRPEMDYEGAGAPLRTSRHGAATGVRQLRDPFVLRDDGELHMIYAGEGESCLAGARLKLSAGR